MSIFVRHLRKNDIKKQVCFRSNLNNYDNFIFLECNDELEELLLTVAFNILNYILRNNKK
jgi:hypothetical protein